MSDDETVVAARRAVRRIARRPIYAEVTWTALFVAGAVGFLVFGHWTPGVVWLACAAWTGWGIYRAVKEYRRLVAEFEAKLVEIQRIRDEAQKQFDETMRRLLAPWN